MSKTNDLLKAFYVDFPLEGTSNKEYRLACVKAQKKYLEENELPDWFPYQGFCERCGRDLFGPGGWTIDEASTQMITGCRFCHHSCID